MSDFSTLLLEWYSKHSRKLPWRDSTDPYTIWVSEIMLQQTRADTVIPYYNNWIKHYPNVKSLAEANERDILLIWEGLGYYQRVKNLIRTAVIIRDEFDGMIPVDTKKLITLPGIGPYTANAIASIAFNKDSPAVDGNIRRIISRVLNIGQQADLPPANKLILHYLNEVMPSGKVGDFNQALMDLGAMVCTPKNPDCLYCPISKDCIAFSIGNQNERPILKKKQKIPTELYVCAVINRNDKYLICHRKDKKRLGGLWEFPNGRISADEIESTSTITSVCMENYGLDIKVLDELGTYRHSYTHYKQIMDVFQCDIINQRRKVPAGMKWSNIQEMSDYPMGKIFRDISKSLI
ncbi:A/G-specific adenine glycosylase [Chloroflexota bacterium]